VTVEYTRMTPWVTSDFKFTLVNGLMWAGADWDGPTPTLVGSVFELTLISSQKWMLFADPPISMQWIEDKGLQATQPYTGEFCGPLVPRLVI
jgi:hypothetical protein